MTHYAAYLRSHVQFALDRVQARSDAAADHARAAGGGRRDPPPRRRGRAGGRGGPGGQQVRGRDAAGPPGGAEELRGVQGPGPDRGQAPRGGQPRRRGRPAARQPRPGPPPAGGPGPPRSASSPSASPAAAPRRTGIAAALADAAQRAGIADDGFGPVDAGDELLATARARVAARRDDIGEIRRLLEAIRDAKAKRAYAEQELGRKVAAEHEQEGPRGRSTARRSRRPSRTRAGRLAAPLELADAAGGWRQPGGRRRPARRRSVDDVQAGGAGRGARADRRTGRGQPGRGVRRPHRRAPGRRDHRPGQPRRSRCGQVRRRLTDLRAERDAIAAEQDDAPPASDLRPATRDARPGAPLWQLVRFAPEIPDETAAAIEGALYGAGLLTAWVHPDPALTRTALEAAEADGYLIPVRRPGEPGLHGRPSPTSSSPRIRSTSPPTSSSPCSARSPSLTTSWHGSDIPAGPRRRCVFGYAEPGRALVASASGQSPKAQFSYGVHVGARPKQTPEYIGATNRADRRRARLAEQDELIAAGRRRGAELPREPDGPRRCSRTSAAPAASCPTPAPVAKAAEAAAPTPRCCPGAGRTRESAGHPGRAIAEARRQDPAAAAGRRRAPHADRREQVDAIARAAAEFENAATQLHAERATLAQAEEDLAERSRDDRAPAPECAEAEAALAERERLQAALEEEFRTLEETLQTDVQQVLEQIRQTERLSPRPSRRTRELDAQARAEHDKATAAEAELRGQRQSLADAVGQLYEQAAAVRRVSPGPTCARWPASTAAARWPDPAALARPGRWPARIWPAS